MIGIYRKYLTKKLTKLQKEIEFRSKIVANDSEAYDAQLKGIGDYGKEHCGLVPGGMAIAAGFTCRSYNHRKRELKQLRKKESKLLDKLS